MTKLSVTLIETEIDTFTPLASRAVRKRLKEIMRRVDAEKLEKERAMDINKADLDRYITGNYGEDQFGNEDGEDLIEAIVAAGDYHPHDRFDAEEMADLCAEADEGLRTMNGDTSTLIITVRQFAILLRGALKGESIRSDDEPKGESDGTHA